MNNNMIIVINKKTTAINLKRFGFHRRCRENLYHSDVVEVRGNDIDDAITKVSKNCKVCEVLN